MNMEWILNELSLTGRYEASAEFLSDIEGLVKLISTNKLVNDNLYCARKIGSVEVIGNKSFAQIIYTEASKNLRQQVLNWVDRKGPYWDDDRQENEDDYFEIDGVDVTDLGLGECARRCIVDRESSSFSFPGNYDASPLVVQHGLCEDVLGRYSIQNLWGVDSFLAACLDTLPTPTTWTESIEQLQQRFTKLLFCDELLSQISILPFSLTVHRRMRELCSALEYYLESRDENGYHTEKTEEFLQNHFHGDKAWFSDETDSDASKFESELSFTDPRDGQKKLYRFHGKIKTPQVRIYFEWPVRPNSDDIAIVYFGPKITKK